MLSPAASLKSAHHDPNRVRMTVCCRASADLSNIADNDRPNASYLPTTVRSSFIVAPRERSATARGIWKLPVRHNIIDIDGVGGFRSSRNPRTRQPVPYIRNRDGHGRRRRYRVEVICTKVCASRPLPEGTSDFDQRDTVQPPLRSTATTGMGTFVRIASQKMWVGLPCLVRNS